MALLKDSLITGDLRVTGTIYGNFKGNGANITSLNASNISSGTLNFSRLPSLYWANVAVSNSSNTATAPTFDNLTLTRTTNHGLSVGSIRGRAVGSLTGEYIHMYERVHIGSPSGWGSKDAPQYGLSTYGGAWLAVNQGNVGIGTESPTQKLQINNGLLAITNNSNTVTIGSKNASFMHIYNSANIPFIFNNHVLVTDKKNLGDTTYPFGNLYLGGANNSIYFVGNQATTRMIRMFDNTTDANGNGIGISGGGLIIIGSGEYTDNLYSALSSPFGGTETTYIGSDNNIYIESNGQTIANRLGFVLNNSHEILPIKAEVSTNNVGSIGNSSYKWANMYATTFHGALDGNAATATKTTQDGDGNQINTTYLKLAGGTMTGQIKSNKNGGSWIKGRDNACLFQTITTGNNWHPVVGFKTPSGSWTIGNVGDNENIVFSYDTDTNYNANTNTTVQSIYWTKDGYSYATRQYGAVWNDFAEFRQGDNNPGRVMIENGNDSVSISTKRLQPGALICSDTFGFAIGETEDCKCPIAVAGRVLAYPLEPREEYNFFIGQAVCSGPNGTVSIMTKDEVKEYPECVVGYISAIPKYETWGTGNVKVDGRVWIKVK